MLKYNKVSNWSYYNSKFNEENTGFSCNIKGKYGEKERNATKSELYLLISAVVYVNIN